MSLPIEGEMGSPRAPNDTDAPPPYETLESVPHSSCELGGDGPELPPPYSPTSRNVFEAPPDYYSLFGQIREARRESENNFTFLRKVGQILLNTIGCTIIMIVFMSVPITVIVFGAMYLGDCPAEPYIPIFLIVGGSSGVLKNITLIVESVIKRTHRISHSRSKKAKYAMYTWRTVNLVFNLFILSWVITGSYWVYHVYKEVNDTSFKTCDELLYKFAFGILTSSYVLLILMLSCTCCCGLCLRRGPWEEEGEGESGHDEEDDRSQASDSETAGNGEGVPPQEEDEEDRTTVSLLDTEDGHHDSNGAVLHTPSLHTTPPNMNSLRHNGNGYSTNMDRFHLAEYTSSPVMSPILHPHPHPVSQSPTNLYSTPILHPHPHPVSQSPTNLYSTQSHYGYSCTAV